MRIKGTSVNIQTLWVEEENDGDKENLSVLKKSFFII